MGNPNRAELGINWIPIVSRGSHIQNIESKWAFEYIAFFPAPTGLLYVLDGK